MSDNLPTEYLRVTTTGNYAQNTIANQAIIGAGNFSKIVNQGDERLVSVEMDPKLGCTPWKVQDLADAPGALIPTLATNELLAAAHPPSPVAYIPSNDPMAQDSGVTNLAKVDLYRAGVDQPPQAISDHADPIAYCMHIRAINSQALVQDKTLFAIPGSSPNPANSDSLFTFMALRYVTAYQILGCATLLNQPVNLTLTITNGIVTDASLLLTVPTISKAFSPASILAGGTSTVTLTLTNPNTGVSLTGAAFTDTLVGMSAAGGAVGGTCTGTSPATLSAGATSLSFSNITIPAGGSCTVTFVVTSSIPGVFTNTASGVSSNEALTGSASNVATLTVVAPPVISKAFIPAKILPGGTTTLTFTITNPNSFISELGVAFTDTLPPSVVVATPNGLTGSCGGGTITATAASNSVSLAGAALAASASCTFSVNVTAPEGIFVNSVTVSSTNGGTGNTATATLFVATPPNLTKSFGAVSITPGGSTTLTFTLMNPNHTLTLTGLAFTDTLPAGLVVSTPNGLTGSCGGGAITAVANTNLISLTGASLAAQASCTFAVNVTNPFNPLAPEGLGLVTNTTSTVTSVQALPGAPASATLFIGDPYQISYTANLGVGDSVVNITNTGAAGAGMGSGTSAAVTGALCANIYVFSPDEQIVSCCSCPVTPDGLDSLSAQRDLISNTFTQKVPPTSIVIKLLATVPVGGTCNNSAAAINTESLSLGLAAWGTRLHAAPAGGYAVTERPFSGATLSAAELARLAYQCGAVLNVGSGSGVCNSCRLGGLGATPQ